MPTARKLSHSPPSSRHPKVSHSTKALARKGFARNGSAKPPATTDADHSSLNSPAQTTNEKEMTELQALFGHGSQSVVVSTLAPAVAAEVATQQVAMQAQSATATQQVAMQVAKLQAEVADLRDEIASLRKELAGALAITQTKTAQHSQPVVDDAEDVEAVKDVEGEGGFDFWFVKADSIRNEDIGFLRMQELQASGHLVQRRLRLQDAVAEEYRGQYAVVSHRWEDPERPDTTGAQLEAVRDYLLEHESVEYIWYDV